MQVEGTRWRKEEGFETAKTKYGFSHDETRSWHGWNRHVSLVMLAYAMMAAMRSQANATAPKRPIANAQKLIRGSIQEIRRLVVKVIQAQIPIPHILRWSVFGRAHQANAYLSRTHTKAQL